MAQGYWNTSASRLWTKIRDNFHNELVAMYAKMRANGLSYESLMSYFYGQQISKIPETYYNKDADTKYLPFADQYMGMAHGNGYEHLKRWLKNRLIFTDTLYDYAPSYNNDVLTIRANTTEPMTITIETYTPVYQHLSWYNNQMDKKKIDGKTAITFTGTAQTATDQEVLIYGGSNIKRITGISSMNPNSMLIGSATRLIELDVSNCPILATVNATGSNFTPHTYLNKLDISNCPNLTGTLRINNSPLLRELNASGTGIDTLQLPPSVRNLEVLRLPNTVTELTLNDAGLLNTLEFDEGGNLQRISLSNCPGIANSNIDLTKVLTVLLDNSYDTQELYMSATTNLTLKNMADLERVIYIPNNEYETFDITTLTNSPNYSVTTFNCPRLTTFMTTAPHRESYNNNIELVEKVLGLKYIIQDIQGTNGTTMKYPTRIDFNTQYIEAKLDITNYQGSEKRLIGIGSNNEWGNSNTKGFDVFWHSTNQLLAQYMGGANNRYYTYTDTTNIIFKLTKDGFYINDTLIYDNNLISNVLSDTSTNIVCQSNAYYEYIKVSNYETEIVQVKDYGDIKPNTTFTANSLDLSNTQFTDIKFLCTTDLYNLKVPTTMKNFYCDSAMDIDTEVITEASYEVIHDELIEQYTTNYEGNVYKKRVKLIYLKYQGNVGETLTNNKKIDSTKTIVDDGEYATSTDLIHIQDTVNSITFYSDGESWIRMLQYNENQEATIFTSNTNVTGNLTISLDSTTKYIRVCYRKITGSASNIWIEVPTVYTPNIIPSSASGSLIFNLYSNNTTQPTSTSPYMWDLTGLKLNDFYTFGMNNWVKASDDSYEDIMNYDNLFYTPGKYTDNALNIKYYDQGQTDNILIGFFEVEAGRHIFTADGGATNIQSSTSLTGAVSTHFNAHNGVTFNETRYVLFYTNKNKSYITIDGYKYYISEMTYVDDRTSGIDMLEFCDNTARPIEVLGKKYIGNPTSITMPQRLPGYSIRMVNADITPNNYANHLYPLLVNTTLPITGKLDYTKYNGTSLAWAYAYTTNDVTRLPLDSRHIGQITNEYNKLYGTDFVDIVDVWAYKDDDFTSKTTNENITKAYIELTSGNFTRRIDEVLQWYPNCTDLYLFDDGSVTILNYMYSNGNNNNGHDTRKQVQNVTFMEGYFNNLVSLMNAFTSCINLVTVSNIPKTVTNIKNCFENCNKFNCQLDFSEFNIANDNLQGTFFNNYALTYPPILPSNYTGNMGSCFQNCSSLVEAPVIPDGVTNLQSCFQGCTSLTTVGNIPSSCNNYLSAFRECAKLTNVPVNGWKGTMNEAFYKCTSLNQQINISSATGLIYTFYNCTSLSITPTLPTTANCSMQSCFDNCTSLVTPPRTPEGVNHMGDCYKGCTNLETAPNIPSSCLGINGMLDSCRKITSVTIPLDINYNNYNFPLSGCTSLTDITWTGERTTDFSLSRLGAPSYTQADIQELVPEHLDDLYKDTIKLDCNNQKITINGNESIYVKSAKYVEYIQGDGEHYIDIDIYANPQWKYELTRSGTDTAYGVVFDAGDFTRFKISDRYQSMLIYNNTNANYDHDVEADTSMYTVTIDKNKCYVNGELKAMATETDNTTQFTKGVRLFKTFQTRTDIYKVSKGKLYSFKMWDENGILQFDGRPCLVNEKYPCLYDEVSKKFFFPK